MLTIGSVCSGIGAPEVAWHPLGWKSLWVSEIDRAASAVLAHRFPDIPNIGDMMLIPDMIHRGEIPAPDILVGGCPCQSFSVAGMRRGLEDARGNLTLVFILIANAIDEVRRAAVKEPCIAVYENVPGLLTSKDNAFGCLLAGLAGESDALVPPGRKWTDAGVVVGPERAAVWRVQDAQFHQLAQRRRRVFVVASAREGFDPAAILLEFDGVRRDSAPRRETGEGVAGTADARAAGGGTYIPGSFGQYRSSSSSSTLRAAGGDYGGGTETIITGRVHGVAGVAVDLQNASMGADVIGTLDSEGQSRGNRGHGVLTPVAFGGNNTAGPIDVATARNEHSWPNGRLDFESETFVLETAPVPTWWDGREVAQTLDAVLHKGQTMPEKDRFPAVLQPIIVHGTQDPCVSDDVCFARGRNNGGENVIAFTAKDYGGDCSVGDTPTLRSMGHDGSHANGGGQVAVVLPFDTTQITSAANYSRPRVGDPCHPLAAGAHPPTIAFQERGRDDGRHLETHGDLAYALTAPNGGGRGQERNILDGFTMAVRRLLPEECEVLQGFPPGWTRVPVGKTKSGAIKFAADGPRYKQCGNSMATHVMHWIGRRIAAALPRVDEFSALITDEFSEILS